MQPLVEVAPSPTSAASIARLLTAIGPRIQRIIRGQVRPAAGLSMPQYIALRALHRGPMSSGALAQRFGVSRPTVTRMVDGLIKKGLVERQIDPIDRRVTMVSLTDAGQALYAATEAAAEHHLVTLLAALPEGRRDNTYDALLDLLALLERAELGGTTGPRALSEAAI